MEKFTLLAKILHCRRHWRHGQIPPLSASIFDGDVFLRRLSIVNFQFVIGFLPLLWIRASHRNSKGVEKYFRLLCTATSTSPRDGKCTTLEQEEKKGIWAKSNFGKIQLEENAFFRRRTPIILVKASFYVQEEHIFVLWEKVNLWGAWIWQEGLLAGWVCKILSETDCTAGGTK